MSYQIVHLPKEKYKGTILPIAYTSDYYYDVEIKQSESNYELTLQKKHSSKKLIHKPEDYDYPDKLYQDYLENAIAWGTFEDNSLIAAIETALEVWSNRLRITELWVASQHRGRGLGRALIDISKKQLIKDKRRALILETQSANVNAIEFYKHLGFQLVGLDTCAYSNNDINNREVRFEFAWIPLNREVDIT